MINLLQRYIKKFPKVKSTGLSHIDVWKMKMLYNYIIKSKSKKAAIEQCSKLFTRGKKTANNTPNIACKISPRPKPNKYLGLEVEDNKDEINNKKKEKLKQKMYAKQEEIKVESDADRLSDIGNDLK